MVGDGTDIGGGASIMGRCRAAATEVVSLGERCLLGANAGLGIALGDDCIVEAGLYLTAGSRVALPDGDVVKARELSAARTGCCSGATRRPARSRRSPARQLGASTPRSTRTTE